MGGGWPVSTLPSTQWLGTALTLVLIHTLPVNKH